MHLSPSAERGKWVFTFKTTLPLLVFIFWASLLFTGPGKSLYARTNGDGNPTSLPGTTTANDGAESPSIHEIEFYISVTLIMGDKRQVTGFVRFKAPEILSLEHEKNGIRYMKKVRVTDIASIEIRRWIAQEVGKNKKGIIFDIVPAEYQLSLVNGSQLDINGEIFPFLKTLDIENSNGKARFFTYWKDLLLEDGSWYTGIGGPRNGYRITPHGEVIQRIDLNKDAAKRSTSTTEKKATPTSKPGNKRRQKSGNSRKKSAP